ncbi:GyrI-like domain-containing protein [Flindersiella endophytica]
MGYEISLTTAAPTPTAVVRASVDLTEFHALWKPMLDDVWAFLRSDDGPAKAGHNVMVYSDRADGQADVEVGVQVEAGFEPAGRVEPSTTPAGRAARTVHRGSPAGIGPAHDAVVAWCAGNGHELSPAHTRWEVYGDWTEDPEAFETEVYWLLA